MTQDTIPSQLPAITIPSALGPAEKTTRNAEPTGLNPVLKWLLVAVLIAVVWHFV